MSGSVSGLGIKHRIRARDLAVQAAVLALHHAPQVHYTQMATRWEGIDKNMKAFRQSYPKHCDCSSFATWCLWNGLDHYGVRDTVNDHGWHSGYTGTMVANGRKVSDTGSVLRGERALGQPGNPWGHRRLQVGYDTQAGKDVIGSHGGRYLSYDKVDYRTRRSERPGR